MKKRRKPVEWKNTAFEWCIERNYSLFVRNRCVFFHALACKYIKILNFAKMFCSPERVVVLYLYGKVKNEATFQKKISEAQYQLISIVLPVDDADLSAYDALMLERKKMAKAGLSESDIIDSIERCRRAIKDGVIDENNSMYQSDLAKLKIIEQGKTSKGHIEDAQRLAGMAYSNFQKPFAFGTNHDEELLKVIRDIYPCGVEANAPDEYGAKMLAMKKMVKAAIDSEETELVIRACGNLDEQQLSFFSSGNDGACRMLDDLKRYVCHKIEEQGALSIPELMLMIRKPPYGYYECNYYVYILARVLRPISIEPYMLFDGCSSFPFLKTSNADWLRKPRGTVFLESKKTRQMVEALGKIFDIRNGWSKSSFVSMLYSICSWCEDNIQIPLGCVDQRWYELMRSDFSRYCYRDEAERYYDWICGNVEQHRKNVRRGKELVYEKYNNRAKIDLFYKFYYVRGGAVGWLHSPDEFYKRIDHYMKSCVCRECGRIIESQFRDGPAYSVDSIDGELLKFSKKDIIGINKKMLGRYQEEYFCIPCLCEIVDATPDQLYEKIHEFKEQGCELF